MMHKTSKIGILWIVVYSGFESFNFPDSSIIMGFLATVGEGKLGLGRKATFPQFAKLKNSGHQ
jgi:hypothetical protein